MAKKVSVADAVEVHVALLRGINVGGRHKLPMSALTAMLEAAGCEDVRTYIQSGNVVYRAPSSLASRVPTHLRGAISEEFGFDVPVIGRTVAQLENIVERNPFLAAGESEDKLHVAFLSERPSAAKVKLLDPLRSPPDELIVVGTEIFLCFPNGVARTKLSNAWLDSKLGTTSTMRNWRTTLKVLELARG